MSKIIEELFSRYYLNNSEVTDVTSSHWAEIGETNISLKEGSIDIKGLGGFGDFVPATSKNKLRHLLYNFLLQGYVNKFSHNEKLVSLSKELAEKSNRLYLMDCAKHVIGIESALEGLKAKNFSEKGINTVCIIGDGYGFMGNLIKRFDPSVKIVFVNLGKQLIFDLQITEKVAPNLKCKLINKPLDIEKNYDMYFLEAEKFHLLEELTIDMFFNVASMQEMNKSVVDQYFKYMRSSQSDNIYFYCVNRIHKTLPDGEEIIFDEYSWNDCEILKESEPEWYQSYPSQRPPFWRPFDGRFKERLVKF